jgi:hypothetical protein
MGSSPFMEDSVRSSDTELENSEGAAMGMSLYYKTYLLRWQQRRNWQLVALSESQDHGLSAFI